MARSLANHAVVEGLVALLVAVVHLVLLRGASVAVVLLFVAPPVAAFLVLLRATGKGARRVALAFLLLVALGAAVAPLPALFPGLGGVDRRLPPQSDRLLTWYAVVYLLFFIGVLPTFLLAGSLARHARGQPAPVSRATCYLGLSTLTLVWPALVAILGGLLGLWPLGS